MKSFINRITASIILIVSILVLPESVFSQQQSWHGKITRPDGEQVVFNFDWSKKDGKNTWVIKNAEERLKVNDINIVKDSVVVEMPVFESRFVLADHRDSLTGFWYKRGVARTQVLPFSAVKNQKRFPASSKPAASVTGRWSVRYESDSVAETVAEFKQTGNRVTGTFLSPTGDYRYLEGVVSGDSLFLSAFDGSHAFLFRATVNGKELNGIQFAGASGKKNWTAVFDPNAKISEKTVEMRLKTGEDSLHFSFKDMDGHQVSISDERFKNKVVVIQLMGSWCPNCMDETAFLSEYYNTHRNKGIEMIALAYEYTTDWERSVKSLEKFRNRFNVKYPVLITGVAVTDSLRTEKTLPELTPIKTFPSSVIIDKKGKVRKLDTGFNGPGTGSHYDVYRKEFETTINSLLSE